MTEVSVNQVDAGSDDILRKRNEATDEQKRELTEVGLYNAQEGLVTRSGGPYLDDLERENAEVKRARIEGREPDLVNPGPHVGTLLVTKDQLVERDASRSHGLAMGTEPNVEPMETYEPEKPVQGEPDPRQKDWDNDTQTYRGNWDNDTQTDGGVPDPSLRGESSYKSDVNEAPQTYEGPVNQPNFQLTEDEAKQGQQDVSNDPFDSDLDELESDADGDDVKDESK
jgi:hypothetical protein